MALLVIDNSSCQTLGLKQFVLVDTFGQSWLYVEIHVLSLLMHVSLSRSLHYFLHEVQEEVDVFNLQEGF